MNGEGFRAALFATEEEAEEDEEGRDFFDAVDDVGMEALGAAARFAAAVVGALIPCAVADADAASRVSRDAPSFDARRPTLEGGYCCTCGEVLRFAPLPAAARTSATAW